MIIDFSKLVPVIMKNFKGGEKEVSAAMFADEQVRIMHSCMKPGASIGMHAHPDTSEIVYALSGEAVVVCDGKTSILHAGQCHYCPQGHSHEMKNAGSENFICFNVVAGG